MFSGDSQETASWGGDGDAMSFPTSILSRLFAPIAVFAVLGSACGDGGTDTAPVDDGAVATVAPAGDGDPAGSTEEPTPDTNSTTETDPPPPEDGSADGTYLGSYELVDEEFGTMVSVTVADGMRTITSNALPDHETGEFPNDGNPNEITAQDLSWEFTTTPVFVGSGTDARTAGVAVNGVKFEPGTGESVTCQSGEQYRIEALQDTYNLGLDFNNAHVQPGGEYHYHGISEMLVEAYDSEDDLVHVGFAADGFLMFYSKSGAYTSGYELRSGLRSGTDCVATGPDDPAVEIEGTTPDGVYTSDWVFTDGLGELDACNGITIDGEYLYVITDTYPFVSRCLNGEFAGDLPGGGGQGGGGGEGGGGATLPDFATIAAELGIDEAALADALGDPPFDLDAAAEVLGIPVEELEAVLPGPPGS